MDVLVFLVDKVLTSNEKGGENKNRMIGKMSGIKEGEAVEKIRQ